LNFKTNLLLNEAQNDPIKRAQAIAEIVKSLAIVPDAITRSLFQRECAQLLDVEEKILYDEVNKQRKATLEKTRRDIPSVISQPLNENIASPFEINELEVVEKEIVRLLLNFGPLSLFTYVSENEVSRDITVEEYLVQEISRDELEFSHPVYKRIFDEFVRFVAEGQLIDNKYFINYPEIEISKTTADLITQKYELSKRYKKQEIFIETEDMKLKINVPELILTYKSKRINLMIKHIQKQIFQAQKDSNEESLAELQQQSILLNNMKRELSKNLRDRVIL
jgi:DNA primase